MNTVKSSLPPTQQQQQRITTILIYGLLLILNLVVEGCSNNNSNKYNYSYILNKKNDHPFHSNLLSHTHTLAVTFAIRANALTIRCKFDRLIDYRDIFIVVRFC